MGYEIDRFDDNVEDFECSICRNVLEDPIQINTCEHMFCRHCIAQWMQQSRTCPVDRMKIKRSQLIATPRFFQIQYNRLKIWCNFIGNGCEEMVKIENIMNHEMNCPCNPDSKVGCYGAIGDENTCEDVRTVNIWHNELIESLKISGRIKSSRVENVMLCVDRSLFCARNPYLNKAQRINYGTTISAPNIHAIILELFKSRLNPGAKVLDIGSGSGYLTVCMALMLGSNGKVIGIDHVNQLIEKSKMIISQHFSFLTESRLEFVTGDGRSGYPINGLYDVINIGGAIDEVPQSIIDQLKPKGRIVVPLICSSGQRLFTIDKSSNGEIKKKERRNVVFGRITDLESQLN